MKNTKLLLLLKTLRTRERTRFKEYIYSPFFNKNKKIVRLLELILMHAPEYEHEDLQKQKIYPFIFPNKKYNEIKLNNIISDLLQLLYDYLSITHFSKQKILQKGFLLKELLEKDAVPHFEKTVRRYRQLQTQQSHRSFEFYENEKTLYSIVRALKSHIFCKHPKLSTVSKQG